MRFTIKYIESMIMIMFAISLVAANAATHYLVPTNTSAANPYTSWATAGTSVIDVLNAAMSNSSTPRTVWVSNGVYMITNYVTITNGVVLKSVNGRDTAIFNGNATYNFLIRHTNCVIDSLTITNGSYYTDGAGGIDLTAGTITNCLITDCVTPSHRGGGIFIRGTSTVANCTIRRNRMTTASYGGGGIYIGGGPATIMNCIIESNIASNYGGGIMINFQGTIVRNCLVRYNYGLNGTFYGGGISISVTNVLVANCTIVSNYSSGSGGGINFDNFSDPAHTNTIVNCVIVSNRSGSWGIDNIFDMSTFSNLTNHRHAVAYSCSTSNKCFILDARGNTTNVPGFLDFAGENYRFNRYSPCFNSGTNQDWMTNSVDLDGHARKLHGRVDMGAYELFIPSGAMYRFR